MTLASSASAAQRTEPPPQPANAPLKAGKPIKTGDILAGELVMMKVREGNEDKRVPIYQLTTEPRRLPQPGGLCNLVTGPETFELVISTSAQAAQLKALIGKDIAVRIGEVACAEDAGEMSEAVVRKWSLVARH